LPLLAPFRIKIEPYFREIAALPENAIRPFAVSQQAWLFSDTPKGTRASATCYTRIEKAKANGLEPSAYINFILNNSAAADTVEKLEALLPWNAKGMMS
jgi:transposase